MPEPFEIQRNVSSYTQRIDIPGGWTQGKKGEELDAHIHKTAIALLSGTDVSNVKPSKVSWFDEVVSFFKSVVSDTYRDNLKSAISQLSTFASQQARESIQMPSEKPTQEARQSIQTPPQKPMQEARESIPVPQQEPIQENSLMKISTTIADIGKKIEEYKGRVENREMELELARLNLKSRVSDLKAGGKNGKEIKEDSVVKRKLSSIKYMKASLNQMQKFIDSSEKQKAQLEGMQRKLQKYL